MFNAVGFPSLKWNQRYKFCCKICITAAEEFGQNCCIK